MKHHEYFLQQAQIHGELAQYGQHQIQLQAFGLV